MTKKYPAQRSLDQIGAVKFSINGILTWVPLFSKDLVKEINDLKLKYGTVKDLVIFASMEENFALLSLLKRKKCLDKNVMDIIRSGVLKTSNNDTIKCYS